MLDETVVGSEENESVVVNEPVLVHGRWKTVQEFVLENVNLGARLDRCILRWRREAEAVSGGGARWVHEE